MRLGPAHIAVLLLLVSAPVLIDWVQHLASHSWALYSLAFPPLLWFATQQTPPGKPRVLSALAVTGLGLFIQFGALASGIARFGRPGFAFCIAGLLLLSGRARFRSLVLLALCIPIPGSLVKPFDDKPLEMLAKLLSAVHAAIGIPSVASAHRIAFSKHTLSLHWTDLGISTGLLAFGLAWLACSIGHASVRRALLTSSISAAAGIAIHLTITLIVFGLVTLDDSGRTIRDFIALGVVGVSGAFWLWRERSSTRRLPLVRPVSDEPS